MYEYTPICMYVFCCSNIALNIMKFLRFLYHYTHSYLLFKIGQNMKKAASKTKAKKDMDLSL